MDCRDVEDDGIAEAYVAEGLDEASRDAFEAHYFECVACFERLEACRALRQGLAERRAARAERRAPVRPWGWSIGLAAAATLAVGVMWMRTPSSLPLPPLASLEPTPTPTHAPPLAVLGQFDPPPYSPATWRDGETEARRRFRGAMVRYSAGDFVGAIPDLRRASVELPAAPEAHFFLGVSLLLEQDADAGRASLERVVSLGDTPYLESALFHLAKGDLLDSDPNQARQRLERVVALDGDLAPVARRLLLQMDAWPLPGS